jgi:hypothetical protein
LDPPRGLNSTNLANFYTDFGQASGDKSQGQDLNERQEADLPTVSIQQFLSTSRKTTEIQPLPV